MNKRTKLCAVLVAAVMAIGLMCFGFAQWSTDVNLNGSVSASGSWEVKVTDAAVELSNAGAELVDGTVEVTPTYDVVVYKVNLVEHTASGNLYYALQLDDTTATTVTVTAAELAEYADRGRMNNLSDKAADGSYYYPRFVSGFKITAAGGDATVMMDLDDAVDFSLFSDKNCLVKAANAESLSAYVGQQVGTAILRYDTSENENLSDPDYNAAVAYFEENPVTTETVAAETTFTDTDVTYAPVNFSLPGAWANYKVTITNNGTANANLSNVTLDFDALDTSIYSVETPDLSGKVLAPGESCTVNLVVKVVAEESFDAESASFHVTLSYVQDAVDEAPSAGYTQSSVAAN